MTKYRLDQIGKVIGGGTPSTRKKQYYANKGIAWITPKDLSGYSKMYISHGARDISQEGLDNSSAKLLPKDTVLVSSRAPIGYVALAANKITTNQGFKSIVPNTDIVLPKYLYYLMLTKKDELENVSSGSTFKEVSGRVMKGFEVDIPSLDKQANIIQKIEPITRKIELNYQINANLVDLINTIYNKFCGSFPSINHETIKDIFCVKTTTYKVSKNRNTNIWHFSIPNFDNGKIGKLENTSDIKSNKKLVNDFSVLISKLNPRFKRVWAPDLTSYPKYESVASPEFIQVSGKDIEQQAVVFAILNSRNYSNFLVSNATGSTNSRQRVKPQIAYSYKIPFNTGKMENLGRYLKPLLQQIQQNEAENNNLQNLKETLLVELF